MEVDAPPRALELGALEAEKQPMAAREEEEEEEEGGPPEPGPPHPAEKNGLVVKLPPDEEAAAAGLGGGAPPQKFTGLGKEELVRAAGAPPWAKARAVLLLLFWLGWLGMLGAAAAIVARAPRCRPLPPRRWWELGGLYRAPPRAFAGDLKGVAARLEHVAGLGARGLVLGPLHPLPPPGDPPAPPPLGELDPALGTPADFGELLRAAQKRGVQVLVDLTPNPGGASAWLGPEVAQNESFQRGVQEAMRAWLERGVAGFFLDAIEDLPAAALAEWRNLTEQSGPAPDGVPRVLVGGTRLTAPPALGALLNASGVGLLLGPFLQALEPQPPGPALAPALLGFLRPHTGLAWSVGSPWQHLAALGPPLARQRLLLLWALPGTPALSYGDEVGLAEPPGGAPPGQLTPMPWDVIDGIREGDNSSEAELLELCRRLGALRARERSLSLGDAEAVPAGPAAAFLRSWDQSERFLVVLNPEEQPLSRVAPQDPRLPPRATLRLSTHRPLPQDPQVDLGALELLPYEGLLLSFPYAP